MENAVAGDLQLLSIEKFAERAGGISHWTVRKWLVSGRLLGVKVGSRRMIPFTELRRVCDYGLDSVKDTKTGTR